MSIIEQLTSKDRQQAGLEALEAGGLEAYQSVYGPLSDAQGTFRELWYNMPHKPVTDALVTGYVAFLKRTGVDLSTIRKVNLENCTELTHLHFLSEFSGLEELKCNYCEAIVDLSGISGCAKLKMVILDTCCGVTDIAALGGKPELDCVDLCGCFEVRDLSPLLTSPKLTYFTPPDGDASGLAAHPNYEAFGG